MSYTTTAQSLVYPLTTDYSTIDTAMNSFTLANAPAGNNIYAGLQRARSMFTASPPSPPNAQVIVLMGDMELALPVCGSQTSYGGGSYGGASSCAPDPVPLATTIKNSGIAIYVLAKDNYYSSCTSVVCVPLTVRIFRRCRKCASAPEREAPEKSRFGSSLWG